MPHGWYRNAFGLACQVHKLINSRMDDEHVQRDARQYVLFIFVANREAE